MAGKYYAVRKGLKTGIFLTWEACQANTKGYSGAEYKSFKTKKEAEAFLQGSPALQEKPTVRQNKQANREAGEAENRNFKEETDRLPIYVDGSFHSGTGEFSYGMVVLLETGEETFCKKFRDPELAAMHNVAGEIKGAEAAMQYALDRGIGKIAIYHDYEGIAKWCTGAWKANKEGTKAYKAFFDEAGKRVDIQFVKVAGHSGDPYNELADQLARQALGIG